MTKLYWWIIAILLTWVLVIRPINMTGKKSDAKNEQEPEVKEEYSSEKEKYSSEKEEYNNNKELPQYLTGSQRGFTV